jgi:hypothetical protein
VTAGAAFLTPFELSAGESKGTRWWKRLLPVGDINYKGRKLTFDRGYLAGLAKSFTEQAYDQVPFQLAGDDNKHTNDVERFGGNVAAMEVRPDGLYIGVDPNERGAKVLADNPQLGVSARIVEAYDRADGKFFAKAIQHVLATLDPRVPGLGKWSAVETSNDDAAVITYDLSGAEFAGSSPPKGDSNMADLTDEQQAQLAKLLDIPADKLAALVGKLDDGSLDALNGDGVTGDDLLTDAELDQLVEDALALDAAGLLDGDGNPAAPPAGDQVPAGAGAALTADQQMAIELAQATADESHRQLGIINAQLDHERWLNERRQMVGAGTPPFIADLAQPLLEGAAHTVDLSNGSTVDAGQIVRKIISEYGKITSQLGIDVELGSPMDEPGDGSATEARNDLVSRARAQMGLG